LYYIVGVGDALAIKCYYDEGRSPEIMVDQIYWDENKGRSPEIIY